MIHGAAAWETPAVRAIALLGLLVLAGCGGGDDDGPPPRPAEPPAFAYALAETELEGLSEAADPIAFLEAEGEVVARADLDSYTAIVLGELLIEEGVDLLSSPLDPLAGRIAERTDVTVLFLTGEQRRRHGARLAALELPEDRLRRFYERFEGVREPAAGRFMAATLAVLRDALGAAQDGRVVVVPVLV